MAGGPVALNMCFGNPIRVIHSPIGDRCRWTRRSLQEVQALRDELVASQNNLSADHTKQRLASVKLPCGKLLASTPWEH